MVVLFSEWKLQVGLWHPKLFSHPGRTWQCPTCAQERPPALLSTDRSFLSDPASQNSLSAYGLARLTHFISIHIPSPLLAKL